MSNRTFSIIKPEIVKNGFAGELIDIILKAGFHIIALKLYRMTTDEATRFYNIHKREAFFEPLTEYMSSGPVIVAILEKENAVLDFRKLIGSTDPSKAEKNTIRAKYGTDTRHNAVHGSDSDKNARIESQFFFSDIEQYEI